MTKEVKNNREQARAYMGVDDIKVWTERKDQNDKNNYDNENLV